MTLKLNNPKNGWKGVYVNQHATGHPLICPVRTLGRQYVHLHANGATGKTYLSATFNGGIHQDVTDKHVQVQVKRAATTLEYPATRGMTIERVNAHSLRSGG